MDDFSVTQGSECACFSPISRVTGNRMPSQNVILPGSTSNKPTSGFDSLELVRAPRRLHRAIMAYLGIYAGALM